MSAPLGRADAHIHLFRNGFIDDSGDEVVRYDRLRGDAGIDAALVVGYEGAPRFAGNNAEILDLSRRLPWVRPTAYVDASLPPSADRIRRLHRAGFVGWSAYLPATGPTLSDWSADRLSALGGGILSLNATPAALERAGNTVAGLDETAVLVSHIGLPGADVLGADAATARLLMAPLLALARHEHVSVKLSGLYAVDPDYPHTGASAAVVSVLDSFGAHRVAWGSDFSPVTSHVTPALAMQIPAWITDQASPDELAAIAGGTLHRHLAHVDSIGGTDA